MNWNYRTGDLVVFNTVQSDLVHLNGAECVVTRRLTEDEADLFETGPMYKLRIVRPDEACAQQHEVTAYEDELSPTDELRFERMVDTYRALGYRMVAFEKYDGDCNQGGWIMAFNTHGRDATDFPISAFDNKSVRDWCAFCGWNLYDEGVCIYDDTDDVGGMIGSYDFTAKFPVHELVKEG